MTIIQPKTIEKSPLKTTTKQYEIEKRSNCSFNFKVCFILFLGETSTMFFMIKQFLTSYFLTTQTIIDTLE